MLTSSSLINLFQASRVVGTVRWGSRGSSRSRCSWWSGGKRGWSSDWQGRWATRLNLEEFHEVKSSSSLVEVIKTVQAPQQFLVQLEVEGELQDLLYLGLSYLGRGILISLEKQRLSLFEHPVLGGTWTSLWSIWWATVLPTGLYANCL